jgi:hypothetical protein
MVIQMRKEISLKQIKVDYIKEHKIEIDLENESLPIVCIFKVKGSFLYVL